MYFNFLLFFLMGLVIKTANMEKARIEKARIEKERIEKVRTETFCPTVSENRDMRKDKTKLRIVQYNVEWLFVDYCATSDCPGNGCAWTNETSALNHLEQVAKVIRELNPDIMNLCEVEGCDELNMLVKSIQNPAYYPYMVKGKDTGTGQNVGMLTVVDPLINLYRTEERVTYPIPGSTCGYTGENTDTGVSKHYITEFYINNIHVAIIGAHLIAFPTDKTRCAEREAQAQILQNVIYGYVEKGYEVIFLGDLNDFDSEVLDANNNKPISMVLDILKGNAGIHTGTYKLFNIAINIPQQNRFTDWWDQNSNCESTSTEFSMIDHILVSERLQKKIVGQFIYQDYTEYCGTMNSDHYPVVLDFVF
jgi:exonuclease III